MKRQILALALALALGIVAAASAPAFAAGTVAAKNTAYDLQEYLEQLLPWLKGQGILIGAYTGPEMRFVTHYGISKENVDQLIFCLKTFMDRKCG